MKNNINSTKKTIQKVNTSKNELQVEYNKNLKEKQEDQIIKQQKAENKIKKHERNIKILKATLTVLTIVAFILALYLPFKLSGALEKIDSVEELKELILSGGGWSSFVFSAIQFLQVTVLPIPSIITTLAGALIFGPWEAFILSFIAIMLGSIFAFWLGKKVGKNIVCWIVGKEDAEKWSKKLERGKYAFFLMMLFPIFPDDVLCLIAGITNMTYKFFILTNLITRPLAIASTCFLGSGSLIPFSGWGIYVWAVLIIAGIVCFYIAIKYQQKIENFINKLAIKNLRKKQHKERLKMAESAKETSIKKQNIATQNTYIITTNKTNKKE